MTLDRFSSSSSGVAAQSRRDRRLPLSHLGFMGGVDPHDVHRLERLLPLLSLDPGGHLDGALVTPGNLFVVRRGHLALMSTHPRDGWTMMVAFAEPGDVYSTLGDTPAPQGIALDDVELTPLSEKVVGALMGRAPRFGLDLAVVLSERIALLREIVTSVGHMQLEDRLWARLIALMERLGIATPEGVSLPVPLTHLQWASLIGGSRESVTILLGRFRREGRVLTEDRIITVPWDVWERRDDDRGAVAAGGKEAVES